ncbi:ribonuclease T2, partial [Jaminaea rosea]
MMFTFTPTLLLTTLAGLASAFPSFNVPSCNPRDLTQLSCSAKYNVSTDSCCFNGALEPGQKESGLVLTTQFWDAQPSRGSKDSTTAHGLWPDYCDGTYPQYCSADSGIIAFGNNLTGIPSIIRKYNPPLASYLDQIYANDSSLMTHEYDKHATCFNTLRPQCQVTFPGGPSQQEQIVLSYFGEIANKFRSQPTYNWLKSEGITPSNTTTYTLAQFEQALTKHYGAKPFVGCNNRGSTFDEVWYYAHTYGPVVGGHYVPTNSTTKSSCTAATIKYLP